VYSYSKDVVALREETITVFYIHFVYLFIFCNKGFYLQTAHKK